LGWLSKQVNADIISKLLSNWQNESNSYEKEIKKGNLIAAMRPLTWLNHVDTRLGYFTKPNEQGKGIIIGGLKDDNFFQFLTQLDIALRLKEQQYDVDLEVPVADKKRIDILASRHDSKLIFELATLDMYSDLKYSGFASDVPDRAKSIMRDKIIDQISIYAKYYQSPIILVLNLTQAHDVDLHGINYSLQGSNVDNMVFGKNLEIVKRITSFERDREFLQLKDANKLSGVIHCRSEFAGNEIKLTGDIIPNETAEIKLTGKTIAEIKQALFGV
jgi:hypothetical protein